VQKVCKHLSGHYHIFLILANTCSEALGLDLPASVFENLEERFEREMLEQGATMHAVLVYGQKPL